MDRKSVGVSLPRFESWTCHRSSAAFSWLSCVDPINLGNSVNADKLSTSYLCSCGYSDRGTERTECVLRSTDSDLPSGRPGSSKDCGSRRFFESRDTVGA